MRPLFPAIRHRTGERPLDISRGARWDRATQGCCGSHGDTIQRAGVSEEFLVYFFHAGGVLISLERGISSGTAALGSSAATSSSSMPRPSLIMR